MLLGLTLIAAAFAGCLGDEAGDEDLEVAGDGTTNAEDPGDSNGEQRDSDTQEKMTAEEQVDDDEGFDAEVPPFYSRTTYTVTGQVHLDRLPVVLSTTSGDINVSTQSGEEWELVATLEGRGETPQEAQQAREGMSFAWTIGEPGDRVLVGQVEHEEQDQDDDPITVASSSAEATLELVIPEDLAAGLQAASTSGDVTVDDVNAHRLDLGSTSGDIDASASGFDDASLDTTSGDVDATLHPSETGEVDLDSTSGDVQLEVPEDEDHGYDLDADTTSGEITIQLSDGTTSTDDDGDEATFRTTDYRDRAIRTEVTLDTTSGDVTVSPAS